MMIRSEYGHIRDQKDTNTNTTSISLLKLVSTFKKYFEEFNFIISYSKSLNVIRSLISVCRNRYFQSTPFL